MQFLHVLSIVSEEIIWVEYIYIPRIINNMGFIDKNYHWIWKNVLIKFNFLSKYVFSGILLETQLYPHMI